jgi:integrase
MTLKELFDEYIVFKEVRVAPKWMKEMKDIFIHFEPIYNKELRDITPMMVEGCFIKEYMINSPVRYNMHITLLRAMYTYAIARGYAEKNVGKMLSFVPHKKTKKNLPTDAEFQALIDASETPFKELIIVLKNTLARVGELNKLKWSDVDFSRRTITLSTNKTGGRGKREDILPLNDEALAALRSLKEWWGIDEMEYVFGGWYPSRGYKHEKLTLRCKRAGVPRITFHTIRHYAASRLSSMGVPIKVIQDLLRHLSLNTTQIYLQSNDKDKKKALDKLNGYGTIN